MPIILISPNLNSIYEDVRIKGNIKQQLAWEKCSIVNTHTGEVLTDNICPLYRGWTYDSYRKEFKDAIAKNLVPPFRFIDTMSAYEPDEILDTPNQVAELKMDGHRCTLHIGNYHNRAFSKRISKKTGWYNENSDQVPHIRDLKLPKFAGTILDGEIKWGKDSTECQSIMGALPETAIQKQASTNKWANFFCFDILYYKGINIQKMPFIKRREYLSSVIHYINNILFIDFISSLALYCKKDEFEVLSERKVGLIKRIDSFDKLFTEKLEEGEEGLIIKDLDGIYEQGKRSKAFLKMKAHRTWDCVFMSLTEPTKEYTGKALESPHNSYWSYWEDGDGEIIFDAEENVATMLELGYVPLTKPYVMGWCGGIRFGVWKPVKTKRKGRSYKKINGVLHELTEVGEAKGLTEEMMEDLKENFEEYIENKRVVEIMAQEMINKDIGSLRHPRFFRFRDDMTHDACTWDKHIGEDKK